MAKDCRTGASECLCQFSTRLVLDIPKHNSGTLLDKGFSCRGPNTTGRPGNHSDFSFQALTHDSFLKLKARYYSGPILLNAVATYRLGSVTELVNCLNTKGARCANCRIGPQARHIVTMGVAVLIREVATKHRKSPIGCFQID